MPLNLPSDKFIALQCCSDFKPTTPGDRRLWVEVLHYAASSLLRGARAPCKRPWVVRSSSRSGQCIPYPAPAMCQFARCSGAACNNRGYHTNGTVMVRPSKIDTDRILRDPHVFHTFAGLRVRSTHPTPPIALPGVLMPGPPMSSIPSRETQDYMPVLKPELGRECVGLHLLDFLSYVRYNVPVVVLYKRG